MLKKLIVALAFSMVPAVAMAQEHQHQADTTKKHEHMMMQGEHKDFALQLIDKRAELKLTDAQVTKLRALSAKMIEHHKAMAKGEEMKPEDEGKLHAQLLSIFNEEQLKKVRPLMRAHMDAMCEEGMGSACKVETGMPKKE